MPYKRKSPREIAKPAEMWEIKRFTVYPDTQNLSVIVYETDTAGERVPGSETELKSSLMKGDAARYPDQLRKHVKRLLWQILKEDHAEVLGDGDMVEENGPSRGLI